jgi:hypothetical protein
MWDRRNLGSGGAGSPIHKFEGHKAAVLCVQACQDNILLFCTLYADMVASYDVFGYLFAIILVSDCSGHLTEHLFLEVLQKMVS